MFCHSPTRIVKYVSEYTFSISKNNEQANKQTKTRIKKAKETKEENIISPENWLKKKIVAARVKKIFLFTRISGK